MNRPFGKLLPASLAALVLASFAMAPYADAAGRGGGGGGGGGGGFGNIFNLGLPLEAGTYNLKLTVGGKDYTTKIVVENDPGLN